MAYPQKPTDQYVANGWYLDLPGLVSPHFETLEGLSRKTGTVDIVDAGTNIRFKFSDQIIDFGAITLTRTRDGSSDDTALNALVTASLRNGVKYAGALVYLHHGVEVFRIIFDGLLFNEDNLPSFDINSGEKFRTTYQATVDEWVEI